MAPSWKLGERNCLAGPTPAPSAMHYTKYTPPGYGDAVSYVTSTGIHRIAIYKGPMFSSSDYARLLIMFGPLAGHTELYPLEGLSPVTDEELALVALTNLGIDPAR